MLTVKSRPASRDPGPYHDKPGQSEDDVLLRISLDGGLGWS